MNFKDLLKKYWFVCVIAIALIGFVGVYAKDTLVNGDVKVSSKEIDGKYAVYSVDDDYVMADDLYNQLYSASGVQLAFNELQKEVVNYKYETTQEMKDLASNNSAYYYQLYGKDYLESVVNRLGYKNGIDDFSTYIIDAQKVQLLLKDYIANNYFEEDYITEQNPRFVYQILIKVADTQTNTDKDGNNVYVLNPTEEEQTKLNEVLEALKTQDFLEVQSQYNEDGSNYPYFVANETRTKYVTTFSDAALALNENEVSEVIKTNYGYHIIKSIGYNKDLLDTDGILNTFMNMFSTIDQLATIDAANQLGFEIKDQALQEYIDSITASEVTE